MNEDRPLRRVRWALSALLAGMLVLPALAAADAHTDNRVPATPDFERVGDTTYRYLPARGEYEMREPGRPPSFVHADGPTSQEVGASSGEEIMFAQAGEVELPSTQRKPVCRMSGNRVVVVWSHRANDGKTAPVSTVRSIVQRMNSKISAQSASASGGVRTIDLAVDCNKQGEILVHEVTTSSNNYEDVFSQVPTALYGQPTGTAAVKYLVLDPYTSNRYAGVTSSSATSEKSRQNPVAITTAISLIVKPFHEQHTTVHELMHGFGAVRGLGGNPAPFSTTTSHCLDGNDVMCLEDSGFNTQNPSLEYSTTRCPGSKGYETPTGFPLDCGTDTYFNGNPPAESWLSTHWDTAGWENPFVVAPPKAATEPVEPMGSGKAGLRGTVNPEGANTTYRFEYGVTTAYGSTTKAVAMGYEGKPTSVATTVSGLDRETIYHYRAVAENEGGTVYGGDQEFKPDWGPVATTKPATAVSYGGATLNGIVNPKGLATTYQFEYGLTQAYGSKAPVSPQAVGSGSTDVAVSQTIEGLRPNTTYYYRIVAVNSGGTSTGENRTLATPGHHLPYFEADEYPANLSGEQASTGKHVLTVDATVGKVDCAEARLQASLSADSGQLSVAPAYSGCVMHTIYGNISTSVALNGCTYLFGISGPPYAGPVSLSCPAGKALEFKGVGCTVVMSPQSLGTAQYANGGEGSGRTVDVSINAEKLSYSRSGFTCGSGSGTGASYVGKNQLSGLNSKGQPTGFYVSGEPSIGAYLVGSTAEQGNPPRLEAERYPFIAVAEQNLASKHKLVSGAGSIECQEVEFEGQAKAAAAPPPLTPAYRNCTLSSGWGQVSLTAVSECSYSSTLSGPPYTGGLTLGCPEGKTLEFKGAGCTVTVPSQAFGSVQYQNVGSGSGRAVTMSLSASGVKMTWTGLVCGSGSTESGTYSGTSTLRGF